MTPRQVEAPDACVNAAALNSGPGHAVLHETAKPYPAFSLETSSMPKTRAKMLKRRSSLAEGSKSSSEYLGPPKQVRRLLLFSGGARLRGRRKISWSSGVAAILSIVPGTVCGL